jgi:hypothetical protein
MKKLLILLSFVFAVPAYAGGQRHNDYHLHNWVAPALIGGLIGYALVNRPEPQVIVVQPAQSTQPYRQAEPVYQEVFIYEPQCGCYYKHQKLIGWR